MVPSPPRSMSWRSRADLTDELDHILFSGQGIKPLAGRSARESSSPSTGDHFFLGGPGLMIQAAFREVLFGHRHEKGDRMIHTGDFFCPGRAAFARNLSRSGDRTGRSMTSDDKMG